MKFVDSWWFPDHEQHLPQWMATPKARMIINGRPAYQGKKQLAAIAECGRLGRTRTAIDVGAHIGLWSFNLAQAFYRVASFEPVAAHRACFERNVFQATDVRSRVENVELHDCALGMTDGSVSIHTAPTSTGDSWVKGAGDIPMHTLDSFGFQEVDLIKIDCEGYEENVIRGGLQTITTWRPVIMVEQKRDMASERFGLGKLGAVQLLLDQGYRVAAELSGDYLCVPA